MKEANRRRRDVIRSKVNSSLRQNRSLQNAFEVVAEEMFLSVETIRQNYYGLGRYKEQSQEKKR